MFRCDDNRRGQQSSCTNKIMHCTFIHLFLLVIGRVSALASTRPHPIDSVASSVTAPIASTLPFPTSDPGHLDRDHNHSYGLMTHTTSYGFMTHRLKIQGSLPVDTQNHSAVQETMYDSAHPRSPNSTPQRLAALQPGSDNHRESGLEPDFRLTYTSILIHA